MPLGKTGARPTPHLRCSKIRVNESYKGKAHCLIENANEKENGRSKNERISNTTALEMNEGAKGLRAHFKYPKMLTM